MVLTLARAGLPSMGKGRRNGVIRDDLLSALRKSPQGLPSTALAERIGSGVHPEVVAAVDAILRLSPEVTHIDAKWVLVSEGRTMRILSVIEAYAVASGRKVFRLSSAL